MSTVKKPRSTVDRLDRLEYFMELLRRAMIENETALQTILAMVRQNVKHDEELLKHCEELLTLSVKTIGEAPPR